MKAFDWSKVNVGFETHLNKTKAEQEAREKTLTKRSPDEAKKLFADFWSRIKDEYPVPSSKMAQFRDELIAEI